MIQQRITVEGAERLRKIIVSKRYGIGQRFARTITALASDIAVEERAVFGQGKNKPGRWTGTTQLSIGHKITANTGTKMEAVIGPGVKTPLDSNRQIGAWIVNFGFGATRRGKWFVGFKNNPGFQQWAKDHGIKTTNKKGEVTGGLVVGGPRSQMRKGLQFKDKALKRIKPMMDYALLKFKNEIKGWKK
jgi:hypothetical protein